MFDTFPSSLFHQWLCRISIELYYICQTHPFIQWLPLPLTLLKIFFSVPEKEDELRVGTSSEYHCGRYKRRGFFSEKGTGGGGGVTFKFLWWPIREDSTRKGYLFQASGIWKRSDLTSWSIWKGTKICLYFRSVKWPKQMLTYAFYDCEKFQNTFRFFI